MAVAQCSLSSWICFVRSLPRDSCSIVALPTRGHASSTRSPMRSNRNKKNGLPHFCVHDIFIFAGLGHAGLVHRVRWTQSLRPPEGPFGHLLAFQNAPKLSGDMNPEGDERIVMLRVNSGAQQRSTVTTLQSTPSTLRFEPHDPWPSDGYLVAITSFFDR